MAGHGDARLYSQHQEADGALWVWGQPGLRSEF